ncbi:MAG: hypothetical protein OXF73_11725 [Gammaproteobacteria bacterium]|nr:hypothetical protein [Gammaproteobacteria bacterium]MCY4227201.1 hypothetical protein [Gammaproteobacteria bacterium]
MIDSTHILTAIEASILHTRPFIHLRLSEVFRQDDYQEILRLLPSPNEYIELRHKDARMPDSTYSRLEFLLTNEKIKQLDSERSQFWQNVRSALEHPDIANAFMEKLAELDFHVPLTSRASLRLSLVRDLPGYFIRPHQDIPNKLLTTQVYLPQNDRWPKLGTKFYTRDQNGMFKTDISVPFLPNSGYAFPVTKNSWHGVDVTPPEAPERNSLMMIWYVDGKLAKLAATARHVLRRFQTCSTSLIKFRKIR